MLKKIFIGRQPELGRLKALHSQGNPSLVVLKGRRRIGKSRLIAEFASKNFHGKFWSFAGLAPTHGMDAQSQRDAFAKQLTRLLNMPAMTFHDWSDAFEHLARHLMPGDIILFDEISWMGAQDATFVPQLKAWWDQLNLPVMLVLCSSVSTWVEENILKSTAFFGRVNLTLTLAPLSMIESKDLLRSRGFQGSPYEMFKLLGIMGGIPWYLEQVGAGKSADEVVKELCFEKDGLLVLEFDRIFHDLFNGKGATYQKILHALKDGMKTLADIRKAIQFPHSGSLSSMMAHLITAGFVQKQHLWSFKTAQPLKQSLYRVCDPYMRFYLKVIEPQRSKIALDAFSNVSIATLPGFDAHVGLQLEYLLLQNRALLLKAMGIAPEDVLCDGPYRQSKTTTHKGCQIDYLVQTRTNNLFVCEFKMKRRELGVNIIDEVKDKIQALKIPRGFAAVPVLFHMGGVTASVATDGYFYRIVDFLDLVEDRFCE